MLKEIREREAPERPEVVILDCVGSSVLSNEWRPIAAAIGKLLKKDRIRIIVNLSELELIDSGAIDELRSSSWAARKQGGTLKLLGPNRFVAGFLATTGVLDLFQLFYDEQKAIDSFA